MTAAAARTHPQAVLQRWWSEQHATAVFNHPDLAATVSNLVEDHEMIASILLRVAELAEQSAGSVGPVSEAINRELDGLAAIMESHFAYEERAIGQALDSGVCDTGWSEIVFKFRDSAH